MHLTRLRLGPLKFFFQLLQEALPCRIKAIHILNTVYFVDKLVAMLKPFMKQELYDKVILNFDDPKVDPCGTPFLMNLVLVEFSSF